MGQKKILWLAVTNQPSELFDWDGGQAGIENPY